MIFSQIDPGDIGGIILGFIVVGVVPVVYMLLHHQRKMAELFHRQSSAPDQKAQLDRMEAEMRALKDTVNQLVIQQDDRRELQARVGPPRIPEHLGQKLD